MPDWNQIRRVLTPVLLIVAVLAVTTGMAWHYHCDHSEHHCVLCHMVIATATPDAGVCELASAPAEYVLKFKRFIARYSAVQAPPRAPPV
jgi:cytochrome c553